MSKRRILAVRLVVAVALYAVTLTAQALISAATAESAGSSLPPSTAGQIQIVNEWEGFRPRIVANLKDVQSHLASAIIALISTMLVDMIRVTSSKVQPGGDSLVQQLQGQGERHYLLTAEQAQDLVSLHSRWTSDLQWLAQAKGNLQLLQAIPYAFVATLLVAVASPVAIIIEDLAARWQNVGATMPKLPEIIVRFSYLCAMLGAVVFITASCYARYCQRIGRAGWRGSLLIGAGAPAAAGLVSILMVTPEMFMAISADNWRPFGPSSAVNLFTYLVFSRLLLLPVVGLVACIALYSLNPYEPKLARSARPATLRFLLNRRWSARAK